MKHRSAGRGVTTTPSLKVVGRRLSRGLAASFDAGPKGCNQIVDRSVVKIHAMGSKSRCLRAAMFQLDQGLIRAVTSPWLLFVSRSIITIVQPGCDKSWWAFIALANGLIMMLERRSRALFKRQSNAMSAGVDMVTCVRDPVAGSISKTCSTQTLCCCSENLQASIWHAPGGRGHMWPSVHATSLQ